MDIVKISYRTIFIVENYGHMGEHSGPSLILKKVKDYFINYEIWNIEKFTFGRFSILRRIYTRMFNSEGVVFHFSRVENYRVSRKVISALNKDKELRVVIIAGENQFTVGLKNLRADLKSRLVVFTHQPSTWYKLNGISADVYNSIGLLGVFGSREKNYFEGNGALRVEQLVHGVDLQFFQLNNKNSNRENGKVLFVGGWLRDFRMLYLSFKEASEKISGLTLHCVIPLKYRNDDHLYELSKLENVYFYHELSNKDLRKMYQTAQLVLLPVKDATANNVLGESIACGTPVLCNNRNVVEWYQNEVWEGVFCSENRVDSYRDEMCNILQEKGLASKLSPPQLSKLDWEVSMSRLHTSMLSWENKALTKA